MRPGLRDKKFVNENASGFDLLRERRKLQVMPRKKESRCDFTIGIPAALHLVDELYLWKNFFSQLGISVVTSESYRDGVREGKKITGAEFCAPVTDIHGHVLYLQERADMLF
jgi:predicted nucleotide-binding protein (sugar kinase/HSP70/actin superfamily)